MMTSKNTLYAKVFRSFVLVLLIAAFGLTSCSALNKVKNLAGGKPDKPARTKIPKPKKTKTVETGIQTTQSAPQTTEIAPQTTEIGGGSQIANPASKNCIDKGGKVSIQKRGDGGEYGICIFEDNLQCEEWAMMNGDCPVGGIKITGYVTPAAQFCAISGGEYTVTSDSNTDKEQGTCKFKNGKTCDAGDYFNGKCEKNQ